MHPILGKKNMKKDVHYYKIPLIMLQTAAMQSKLLAYWFQLRI
jgi:hypothetical protein